MYFPRFVTVLLGVSVICACAPPDPAGPWQVISIIDASDPEVPGHAASEVRFANGGELEIPLRDVTLQGLLRRDPLPPWLVVSGITCSECDDHDRIYLFRVDADSEAFAGSYPYPGEQYLPGVGEDAPFFQSRAFFGSCLPEHESALVWLQSEPGSDGGWTRSVKLVMAGDEEPIEVETEWTAELGDQLAASTATEACREIPGITQYVF